MSLRCLRTLVLMLLPACLACASEGPGGGKSMATPYSPAAQALIDRAFADLDPTQPVIDVHVHALGLGQDEDGAFVNPEKLSARHPLKRFETGLYLKATGVKDMAHFDRDYVTVLVARARAFPRPLRIFLLALDRAHHPDGTPDLARTEFYVPNAYVLKLAREYPDLFVPVISVHPARPDAIQELEACAAQGARMVKWLPNAQTIDPADPRYDAFYRRMKDLGMVLLSHAGEEKAVAVKDAQALGNPLRLRRPLDLGVTVIVAHCASLGSNADLDHAGKTATNFSLFLRLMATPKYKGLLFGDLSAMTQVNRLPKPLLEILARPDFEGRLVNGSDYPLPGVDLVIWIQKFVQMRMITSADRRALLEIRKQNPLLFDFVLKRTLKEPKSGRRLPVGAFQPLDVLSRQVLIP